MGGKGSGGFRANGIPDKANPIKQAADITNVDPEGNSKALRFTAALMSWDAPDYQDADAMRARFVDFLELCDSFAVKPQVMAAALAFGMSRDAFSKIARGDKGYSNWHDGALTPESRLVIQKAYQSLSVVWETELIEERGNPVKWIFLGKNYYGMRDQSEHVVSSPQSGPELPSPEDVAAKYAKMVGKPPELTEGE